MGRRCSPVRCSVKGENVMLASLQTFMWDGKVNPVMAICVENQVRERLLSRKPLVFTDMSALKFPPASLRTVFGRVYFRGHLVVRPFPGLPSSSNASPVGLPCLPGLPSTGCGHALYGRQCGRNEPAVPADLSSLLTDALLRHRQDAVMHRALSAQSELYPD